MLQRPRSPRRISLTAAVTLLAATAGIILPATANAAAATLYVDRGNVACSDTGPGSVDQPFCTITRAATVALAGQTVEVAAGSYPESPALRNSGTAGSPITLRPAPGAAVTVTGTPGVAGARGFAISGKTYITITGFTVTGTAGYGIYVFGSSNVSITGNTVSGTGARVSGQTAAGIYLNSTTSSDVTGNVSRDNSDAGILVTNNSSGVRVAGNTTFGNAQGYQRAAPGIDVRSGPNTIVNNVSYNNEDSGLQFYTGAHDNLVIDNLSYNNGDHGIDDLNSPNQVIVGNTVYRNVTAGINLEGTSTGGYLRNNISVDNGINSPRTSSNIRVDSQSISGATADYNLVWLTGGSIQYAWGSTSYTSLAAMQQATGQEAQGRQADPLWAAPGSADFRLAAGSPAIDAADSAATGQPATDAAGNPRVDDPGTPDTGAGPRTYDDRGALEFQGASQPPVDNPPVARLSVSPLSGPAPLQVTADASGSTDTDATPIASYAFDFGDGTSTGAQTAPAATKSYPAPGSYQVTVTVTDTAGLSSTASATVTVAPPSGNLVRNPGFETNLSDWTRTPQAATLTRVATMPHGGSWAAALTNPTTRRVTCTLDDSPNSVRATVAGTYTATVWVRSPVVGRSITLRLRELSGGTTLGQKAVSVNVGTAWRKLTVSYAVVQPGSMLDLRVLTGVGQGTCFYADDVSLIHG